MIWSGTQASIVFKSPSGDSNAQSGLRPTHPAKKLDIHQKTEWDIFTIDEDTVITANIY